MDGGLAEGEERAGRSRRDSGPARDFSGPLAACPVSLYAFAPSS